MTIKGKLNDKGKRDASESNQTKRKIVVDILCPFAYSHQCRTSVVEMWQDKEKEKKRRVFVIRSKTSFSLTQKIEKQCHNVLYHSSLPNITPFTNV